MGEVVRDRREELGLTKAELARRAHLTRSSIHEIEADLREHLQTRTRRSLEDALGLPAGAIPTTRVFISHSGEITRVESGSLRSELESALSDKRYDSLLELIMRVADRLDELEDRLAKS